MGILATMKEKLNAKKSKRDNDELKLINIYLYIDRYNYKIIAHTVPYANTEYIPFIITPKQKVLMKDTLIECIHLIICIAL